MAATFLLIRHAAHIHLDGTLTGRLDGVPLSEKGRAQARALAERLSGERIDRVVSSPRERARDTAAAIAAAHGLSPETSDGVDEIDFGGWTGRRFSDLEGEVAWRWWNAARGSATAPGGEAAAAAQARAVGELKQLAAEQDHAVLAVVTHADIIRSVVCDVLGLPLDRLLRFSVDAGSVTRVAFNGHGAALLSLNEGMN